MSKIVVSLLGSARTSAHIEQSAVPLSPGRQNLQPVRCWHKYTSCNNNTILGFFSWCPWFGWTQCKPNPASIHLYVSPTVTCQVEMSLWTSCLWRVPKVLHWRYQSPPYRYCQASGGFNGAVSMRTVIYLGQNHCFLSSHHTDAFQSKMFPFFSLQASEDYRPRALRKPSKSWSIHPEQLVLPAPTLSEQTSDFSLNKHKWAFRGSSV